MPHSRIQVELDWHSTWGYHFKCWDTGYNSRIGTEAGKPHIRIGLNTAHNSESGGTPHKKKRSNIYFLISFHYFISKNFESEKFLGSTNFLGKDDFSVKEIFLGQTNFQGQHFFGVK